MTRLVPVLTDSRGDSELVFFFQGKLKMEVARANETNNIIFVRCL